VRRAGNQGIEAIKENLRHQNLLISPNTISPAQKYPALLILALFGLGIAKILVGISRGKPVGYLFLICFFVAIIGFYFYSIPVNRSLYGDKVIKNLRTHVPSKISHTNPQFLLAFALWETQVLEDAIFAELKKLLSQVYMTTGSSSNNSSGGCGGGGCSSGCGGGGGCGGGCGGCSG
jgi:uncharacterized membrane protein YgcG